MHEIPGGAVEFPLKGFQIIRVVIETASHARAGHGSPAAEHIPGNRDPLFDDVLIKAHACEALEELAQVKLADIKFPGDVVQR